MGKTRAVALMFNLALLLWSFFIFINLVGNDRSWRLYASGIGFSMFLFLVIAIYFIVGFSRFLKSI